MTVRTRRARLAIAVMGTALGSVLALGAPPASAAVPDEYVRGKGAFNNDWADEGTVSTTLFKTSNVACLWQKILTAEGLYKESKVNGHFSNETAVATKKLQSRWNITPTGKADRRTFDTADAAGRLKFVSGSTADGKVLTLKYQGTSNHFTLKRDTKGRYAFYADGDWRSASYKRSTCR